MGKFNYMGKTTEELKKMDLDDFAELLKSGERRKIRRGLRRNEKKLLEDLKNKDYVKTHLRDMIIIPQMIGKKIGIHNGKEFVTVVITPEMLGHRLGDFALTRKQIKHSAPGVGATKTSKYIPLK